MCQKNTQQENFKHCQAKSNMLEGTLKDMSEGWDKELKEQAEKSNKQLIEYIEALEKTILDMQTESTEKPFEEPTAER